MFRFAAQPHLLPLRTLMEGAGVTILGLRYASEALAEIEELAGTSLMVEVRIDSSDMSHVWVFDPYALFWVEVPCESYRYSNGLPLQNHAERRLRAEPDFLNEVSKFIAFRLEKDGWERLTR